jgi:hypothetical protein
MTLLSAAIISASGNAFAPHNINTCCHQQTNQEHRQSVEVTTANSLESHTTPIFCSMIILFMLPTVHKRLPCYILQWPSWVAYSSMNSQLPHARKPAMFPHYPPIQAYVSHRDTFNAIFLRICVVL